MPLLAEGSKTSARRASKMGKEAKVLGGEKPHWICRQKFFPSTSLFFSSRFMEIN